MKPLVGMNQAAFVWFRSTDLRMRDHHPLFHAARSASRLYPIFCFDPDEFLPRNIRGNMAMHVPKLGPFRLRFRLEALESLASDLEDKGSKLFVFKGSASHVLEQLLNDLREGLSDVGLYFHQELGPDAEAAERAAVSAFQATAAGLGVKASVHSYFGASLLHPDDVAPPGPLPQSRALDGNPNDVWLPLISGRTRFAGLPPILTDFRKEMERRRVPVREPLPPPTRLPLPFPAPTVVAVMVLPEGPVEAYRQLVPSYLQDGLAELTGTSYDRPEFDGRSAFTFKGGEREGLRRLSYFLGEDGSSATGALAPIHRYKETRMMASGVDNSAKMSAYLSCGCVSPRTIHKAVLAADTARGALPGEGPGSTLLLHLMIRDFFIYTALRAGSAPEEGREQFVGVPQNSASQEASSSNRTEASEASSTQKGKVVEAVHQRQNQRAQPLIIADEGAKANSQQPQSPECDHRWAQRDGEGHAPCKQNAGSPTSASFRAWASGRTGFPFVDACMRELAHTGYMSNRGRQNVANFLAKVLKEDWQMGAALFECLLVDYDFAANWGNWAYNAGEGADPRNRLFKTVSQGMRYDPDAEHIKAWVPELAAVSSDFAHQPWLAAPHQGPSLIAQDLSYPTPIVPPEGQIGKPPM